MPQLKLQNLFQYTPSKFSTKYYFFKEQIWTPPNKNSWFFPLFFWFLIETFTASRRPGSQIRAQMRTWRCHIITHRTLGSSWAAEFWTRKWKQKAYIPERTTTERRRERRRTTREMTSERRRETIWIYAWSNLGKISLFFWVCVKWFFWLICVKLWVLSC